MPRFFSARSNCSHCNLSQVRLYRSSAPQPGPHLDRFQGRPTCAGVGNLGAGNAGLASDENWPGRASLCVSCKPGDLRLVAQPHCLSLSVCPECLSVGHKRAHRSRRIPLEEEATCWLQPYEAPLLCALWDFSRLAWLREQRTQGHEGLRGGLRDTQCAGLRGLRDTQCAGGRQQWSSGTGNAHDGQLKSPGWRLSALPVPAVTGCGLAAGCVPAAEDCKLQIEHCKFVLIHLCLELKGGPLSINATT
jgi:hypothetical protein